MKYIWIVFILFISIDLFSQTDNTPYVSVSEAEYLDSIFNEKPNDFSFRNKKVGFVKYYKLKGTNTFSPTNKQSFFYFYKEAPNSTKKRQYFKLLLLSDKEKIDSGGYDAFVIVNYLNIKGSIIISELNREYLINKFFNIEQALPSNLYNVLGSNNDTQLNDAEVYFLNKKYSAYDDSFIFDFKGKKIAFFSSSASSRLTKNEYFNKEKACIHNGGAQSQLILLTDEQKKRTGGYDAIIVLWRKRCLKNDPKRLEYFIKQLES